MIRRALAVASVVAGAAGAAACDPCAGTPICSGTPEISYTGRFIEHRSGRPVGNVVVQFVRTGGIPLDNDSIQTRTWESGFFKLHGGSAYLGEAIGELHVFPPLPYRPYTVDGVAMKTRTARADGYEFGRLVVNPYVLLLAEVHDRYTDVLVPGATVTISQTGGVSVLPAPITVTADVNGRILIEPPVERFGDFTLQFDVEAGGYPRIYRSTSTFRTLFRDAELIFVLLRLRSGIQYYGRVSRRGTGDALPGAQLEFRRTGGIHVSPDTFVINPDPGGYFGVSPMPIQEGTLIGDIIVRPPPPFPAETIPDMRMSTADDNSLRLLGDFGYGTQVYLNAQLRYRATGKAVERGVLGVVRPVAGLPLIPRLGVLAGADTGVRGLLDNGTLVFGGATPDTGEVRFDLEIRLNPPHVPEFIRNVRVPSRASNAPYHAGAFRVGLWHPSVGEVRDQATDLPIAGAQMRFQRTAGARLDGIAYDTVSAANGQFPLHPTPLDSGVVTGTLRITTGGVYRDTTIAGVQLRATQTDTLRSVGIFRLTKAP